MRLIDADTTLDALREVIVPAEDIGFGDELTEGYNDGINMAITVLSGMPPVDAVPVRRGKWILQGDRRKTLYGWYFCSECGACIGGKTNFCSECGADMREVDDE